ncbi:hypothetical protein KUV62_13970 [Salipiger bermudensis]|uniref:hypothetical protein n=1 Tax=Salipiger bermudensis TaxID=344736 RepID=UPI001C99E91E|nr:hypothetical protein [Salipiger bermudensis]MBY6005024.1 hypothetical protein [Salipiger bermudensis]
MLAIFALGCSPHNLYVAHDTVVGVNARVSADRQQGQLLVGYDRDFVTIIPVTVQEPTGDRDAMALLSCTELVVDGVYLSQYTDITASGKAAQTFAKALQNGDNVFNCDPLGGNK